MSLIKSKQVESLEAIKVTYNDTTTQFGATNVQDAIGKIKEDLEDCAKLNENNVFTGSNTFGEAFLEQKTPYVGENRTYGKNGGGQKKTGRRDFTSHSNGNDGYVKSIIIRVSNGLAVNEKTNLSVWEVTKGDTIANDTVQKIKTSEPLTVYGGTGNERYVKIDINAQYNTETYFIYQFDDSGHLAYSNIRGNENAIYLLDDDDVTPTNIDLRKNASTVGIYWLIGRDINIREKIDGVVYENKENVFSEVNHFKDVTVLVNHDSHPFGTNTAGYGPSDKTMGVRKFSTSLFTDGYVEKIRIYGTSRTIQPVSGVNIWSVIKGTDKNADTVDSKIINNQTYNLIDSNNVRYIDIPINRSFNRDTYFLFRCSNANNLQSVTGIDVKYSDDIVNIDAQPVDGQRLDFSSLDTNWVTHIEVIGRVSVKDFDRNTLIDANGQPLSGIVSKSKTDEKISLSIGNTEILDIMLMTDVQKTEILNLLNQ